MPEYKFKNKKTGKLKTYNLKISEYDKFKEDHPNLERVIDAVGLMFRGQGNKTVSELAAKRDPGWGEVLAKIGQNNPNTQLNSDFTKNKTAKRIKTEQVVEKHAKLQAKQRDRKR